MVFNVGPAEDGEKNEMKFASVVLTLSLLCFSGPSSAHTKLAASSPADGAEVNILSEIRLDFSAAVKLTAVKLVDTSGTEIGLGAIPGATAETFTVTITESLATGTYVISWRSISSDAHIVSGEIRFSVTD
jgi:methionine-rich copper-binding protein CopC